MPVVPVTGPMECPMRSRERGVALISIMLVVVIATVLAVQMTNEQRLVIQRTANHFDAAQARQYALGGEELARQILRADFEEQPGIDSNADAWANPELQFEFENGAVEVQIEDLQGRLNLNNLYPLPRDGGDRGGDASVPMLPVLSRMMGLLGVDPVFSERTMDWIDPDDGKGSLGAEDFDYLGLEVPYRAADRPIADVSELRLLLEMTPEAYGVLSPFVAALPASGTTVNVNTAPAPVIAALAETLTLESAEALVAARDQGSVYESVTQFLQDPILAGSGLAPDGLGVQSGFFRVSVRARFLDRFAYLTSIVQRNPTDGSMRVVYRDMSKQILPIAAPGSSNGDG